jgi:hypothetical protein
MSAGSDGDSRLRRGAQFCDEVDFSTLVLIAETVIDGRPLERRSLWLNVDVPVGYHRMTVEPSGAVMTVIVAPDECWFPELPIGKRLWGIAAQLYLLRSGTNWGIGDFGDLQTLVTIVAGKGGDLIGLNPLHALFTDDPCHASPYSPASRLLLNVLNIDVNAVPELKNSGRARDHMTSRPFQLRLQACRTSERVDYEGVARLEMAVMKSV